MILDQIGAMLFAGASLLISAVPIASAITQRNALYHSRKAQTAEFRLKAIIYPLFTIAEPYMKSSKSLTDDDAKEISSILQRNGSMIGNLVEYQQLFASYKSSDYMLQKKHIDRFFSAVNAEFDAICQELGIPKRSIRYRCKNYRFVFSKSILFSVFISFAFFLSLLCDSLLFVSAALNFIKTGNLSIDALLISLGITFILWVIDQIVFSYLEK